jgi:hypothetical protein
MAGTDPPAGVAMTALGESKLPDFIILGAMKAGTTTLFRRLASHPETALPTVKEPQFSSEDHRYRRGAASYASLFPHRGVTGEASVAYSDPRLAPVVAERVRLLLPGVRLVFLARHPVERMRSHYLHEALKGRETTDFTTAISAPDNPYVRRSCYARAIAPYVEVFPPEHLMVIQSERLDDPTVSAQIQHFLGLTRVVDLDQARFNESSSKQRETSAMSALRRTRLLRVAESLPGPLRQIGKPLVVRSDGRTEWARAEARHGSVPAEVTALLRREVEKFVSLLHWSNDPWFSDLG